MSSNHDSDTINISVMDENEYAFRYGYLYRVRVALAFKYALGFTALFQVGTYLYRAVHTVADFYTVV